MKNVKTSAVTIAIAMVWVTKGLHLGVSGLLKSISGSWCKSHGNWSPTSKCNSFSHSNYCSIHIVYKSLLISRPGIGLHILFIWWNAKTNIFLVYNRKILLSANAAFKGQKALHPPHSTEILPLWKRKKISISTPSTHTPISQLRNANYFLWGYFIKGGCTGHIL